MRAFKNPIRQEVAKHFAGFFLEVESNFEHEAEASDREPEVHVMEPLADNHSSDSDDTPTGQRHQRHQRLPLLQREQP